MEENIFFNTTEKELLIRLYRKLLRLSGDTLQPTDYGRLKLHLTHAIDSNRLQRDNFGLNPLIKDMQTACIIADEIGMKRASVLGIMLHNPVKIGILTTQEIEEQFG